MNELSGMKVGEVIKTEYNISGHDNIFSTIPYIPSAQLLEK